MRDWNYLLSNALIGTANRTIGHVDSSSPTAALLAKVDVSDKERCLLRRSGIVSVVALAGYQPVPSPESQLIEPAEKDTMPMCTGLAAGMLCSLIANGDAETVADWLQTAARKQRRVPPERLPEILNFGVRHRALRNGISAVVGRRGAWLARLNPDWEYAAGLSSQASIRDEAQVIEIWETGSLNDRCAILEEIRKSDPEAGRRMVESTWNSDPMEARVRFIPILSIGLSLADEPFLESALDDKRKEVRQAAEGLLRHLENSAFSNRMTARFRPLITLKRSLLGGESMEVQLPGEWDSAMGRDGISAKPAADSGYGERAWLLRQMAASIAPSWWQGEFNLDPGKLIRAAAKNADWKDVLLCGWTEAANRWNDLAWKEALVWFALDNPKAAPKEAKRAVLPSLTGMSADRLESLLIHMLSVIQNDRTATVLQVLETRTADWSTGLSRIAVEVAFEDIRRSKQSYVSWHAGRLLQLASVLGPATPLEEFESMWHGRNQTDTPKCPAVDRFLEKLRFRQEMYRALEEEQ